MRAVIFSLFILIVIAAFIFGIDFVGSANQPKLPKYSELPQFTLNSDPETTFSKDSLLGKVTILQFFFTSCKGICPTVTANISGLQSKLFKYDDVQIVSVAIDPERDTFVRLVEYALNHNAKPERWTFLRGDKKEVDKLLIGTKVGVPSEIESHSTRIMLIDREGFVRGHYQGLNPKDLEKLAEEIKALL